jgi:hypothetical protein
MKANISKNSIINKSLANITCIPTKAKAITMHPDAAANSALLNGAPYLIEPKTTTENMIKSIPHAIEPLSCVLAHCITPKYPVELGIDIVIYPSSLQT